MSLVIYKYEIDRETELELPWNAKIIKAGMQPTVRGLAIMIWVLLDLEAPKSKRIITVHGTGHPMEQHPGRHVETVFQGDYVWHVFERPENLTADKVRALRELTGCGMMECKRALTETYGNMDAAAEILRTRGLA